MSSALWAFFLLLAAQPAALDKVQANFKGKSSFEVEFQQKVFQELFPDKPDLVSGRILYDRPAQKMRWIYEKPENQKKELLYKEGKLFRLEEGEKPIELTQPEELSLEDSFSFLWGEASSKDLKLQSINSDSFKIIPKNSDNASFQSIEVLVDRGFVQKAVVVDQLDGRSEFVFENWKLK